LKNREKAHEVANEMWLHALSGCKEFQDEALVFGAEIGALTHVANDGFYFARRNIFGWLVGTATVGDKASLTFVGLGGRGICWGSGLWRFLLLLLGRWIGGSTHDSEKRNKK